jgi:hypothetical protein
MHRHPAYVVKRRSGSQSCTTGRSLEIKASRPKGYSLSLFLSFSLKRKSLDFSHLNKQTNKQTKEKDMSSRVLSVRLKDSDLQGVLDFSSLVLQKPTDRCGTALSRFISFFVFTLRRDGKIPNIDVSPSTSSPIGTERVINPTSMPSLEASSIASEDSIEDLDADLEMALRATIQEIELEQEVDLLSKILIS